MKRLLFIACALFFFACSLCSADLTYPAAFEIKEEQPGQFRLSLTVPLVKGRYLKLQPVLPDGFQALEEPEVSAGDASLTYSWVARPAPDALYSAPFGLEGLLGTVHQVRFSLTTLDGRRFESVLRPTHPFFSIPTPKAPADLMVDYGRRGLRGSVRSFGMWSMLAALVFCGLSARRRAICILISIFGFMLYRFLALPAYPPALSGPEQKLAAACLISGLLAGGIGLFAALELIRSLLRKTVCPRISFCTWTLTAAWCMYQGAGLIYHHGLVWAGILQRLLVNLGHHWFSPFAADWAMARLRIPLLSMTALVALIVTLIRIRKQLLRITLSFILLVLVFILLPHGVARASLPYVQPKAPTAKQAQQIIEPMLSKIYLALNLKDEGQAYDELAEQIAGNLGTDLYLDSRRRLVNGLREGASVEVKRVQLDQVNPQSSGAGRYAYSCSWNVTAKVTHWQHIHERNNLYKGDLGLVVEDGLWKLSALNLHSEERTIVPGSFISR